MSRSGARAELHIPDLRDDMRKVGEDVTKVIDYVPGTSKWSNTSVRRSPAGAARRAHVRRNFYTISPRLHDDPIRKVRNGGVRQVLTSRLCCLLTGIEFRFH
jgi:hypothetical protein